MTYHPLTMNLKRIAKQKKTKDLIKNYMEKGALGIGLPVGYYLGASAGEIF
jgi:hypothetical protein